MMNRPEPPPQTLPEAANEVSGGVHQAVEHDSALKHLTGRAVYIDDLEAPSSLAHAYLGLADCARGKVNNLDLSAVIACDGVIGVITPADILGDNDISPTHKHDEPILAEETVSFHGQALFAVIAESRDAARRAARRANIEITRLSPAIDALDAVEQDYPLVTPPLTLRRGDAAAALEGAEHRVRGRLFVGGQDHFYLEGHIALAIPGEDDQMTVWSSTQHPSEVQHMVAQALGTSAAAITVNVRRMGGAFGGKETQSNQFAVIAAIAARKFGRPVKLRPDRDDDMVMTGKRHDCYADYDIGFNSDGVIEALSAKFLTRCGYSSDLSGPVTDRTLFHTDNCYYLPNVRLQSAPLKTNTVSNTAFRGFGGPQGVVASERIIEEIAYALGRDPLEIRKANFYREGRDITPYHQRVEDNIIERIVSELEETSAYQARRKAILDFNKENTVMRKGIALTPVKFGISFTATWFNQAGALVHVYQDGSIHLNHGGTEMGQGLNTKVAQVVADAFKVDLDHVQITETTTGKVPNTSPTAASSGSDLNAMAALDAAEQIKARLVTFASEKYKVPEEAVTFLPGYLQIGKDAVPFSDLVKDAYMVRTHLSAAGFYRTPKIHWDRENGTGRPFYYFAYGAAVSEATIDTLTGEYVIDRVDILHDVGKSLNPAIDIGQVEGGFIQGMGWLTTEELWWDDQGRLRTHAPSTYKIPLASDVPEIFNVELAEWSENAERTIKRSKAVGEPPLMLATSVVEALSMAVASVGNYSKCPRLNTPVTPECVLMAVERMRQTA
ncbi:MAG: xanthine dehydrogenase molybdopterin binding subunit [Pseudomonadota bacterium]